jgi:amino acid adenylation domain-containing protein
VHTTSLTDAERHKLLVEWNDTAAEYPRDKCIHQLFEEQVARTPDAVAVVFEAQHLTYRELDERADCLAHRLRDLGVGPEILVGICMERSLEMVVALLGILKAGGAYVPIDPDYPAERVAFMITDAGSPVLLTQSHLVARLPKESAHLMVLDADWKRISSASETAVQTGVTSTNLAYMIYTSGSTGQPKGALNTHRGICNRLLWMQDQYKLSAQDVVMQKTPFSFDVSVWEFFWPLIAGAQLALAKPGGHKDVAYLVQFIRDHHVTTLHFVPPMLRAFLAEPMVETCRSLRRVVCSGEALPHGLQQEFFARLDAQLHNLYGPTEAAVDVTHWTCRRDSDLRIVPIGRPVANTQCYILDGQMQPLPVGIPGELHLGGVQVGRGYHNRPDLTAEKFIPNPFSSEPGARLYKTGDLCRYLPDGNIEFLGRLDHQVKIRGFRIELGEIEAVLGNHPAVQSAVVVALISSPLGRGQGWVQGGNAFPNTEAGTSLAPIGEHGQREISPSQSSGCEPLNRGVGQAFQPAGAPDLPVRGSERTTGKSPAPADRNVRPTPEVTPLLGGAGGGSDAHLGHEQQQGKRMEANEFQERRFRIRLPPFACQEVFPVHEETAENRLVAYVVHRQGSAATASELRDYLKEKLPDYMIPSAFVKLERFPLNANGKIDRKALPDTEGQLLTPVSATVAARTPLERQLVQLWESVLDRSPIGINDDFFDLGGHSLLAVKLIAKLEKLTGRRLPLVSLFEGRTIERLALALSNPCWKPRWTSLVPIKPGGSRRPFYCVHGIGGNVLEFEHFSRYIGSDQPLYGIQAQGLDGKQPRHTSVAEMAAHYIREIQEFQPDGPYFLGGSSFGGVVAYEMAQQLLAQNQKVGLLVMFDSFAPGHPKWQSRMTGLRKRYSAWRSRFDLHWCNLKAAQGCAKLDYLMAKSIRFAKRLRWRCKQGLRFVIMNLGAWLHPKAIREVREAAHTANSNYVVRPYPGSITLLRAREQPLGIIEDRTNGWGEFALGGVDVRDVPGHHGGIMREPRARFLVEKLTACLHEAQLRCRM